MNSEINSEPKVKQLKQYSLWKNHIKERSDDRFIDEISAAEAEDYLPLLNPPVGIINNIISQSIKQSIGYMTISRKTISIIQKYLQERTE